jgi:hypothetical protein
MNDREFYIVTSALDDNRKLIAAGKIQRWDVVKWGFTVNVALATVAAAFRTHYRAYFGLAVAVAIASCYLVLHYNRRMTTQGKWH